MLAEFGDDGCLYGGGTELLLAMKHDVLRYKHLVDVKVIPGLDSIGLADGTLRIGATVTHRTIEKSDVVRERLPVLAEMESHVANVRVRATGTLGGNLCFAEPHSDPATLLLVLNATVLIEGPSGQRETSIEKFFTGAYQTSLGRNEVLTAIHIPVAKPDLRSAYIKFQIYERPTLGLGLVLNTPDGGSTITGAQVAVGCVSAFPRRSPTAEDLLVGARPDVEHRLSEAAEVLAEAAELADDHEGSADYKRHLIGVFLRRAFLKAMNS